MSDVFDSLAPETESEPNRVIEVRPVVDHTLQLPSPLLIRPPTGRSILPIIELDRAKMTRLRKGSKKRKQAHCSFGNYTDRLPIDAWPFFHAAKKTELTTSFTTASIDRRALCFAAEYEDLFVWNTANLRK